MRDSNNTPLGIDKSKCFWMILILSFSSSMICIVMFSLTKLSVIFKTIIYFNGNVEFFTI